MYGLVEGNMHSNERVEVDPRRAMHCGWCGTLESDQWNNDIFRNKVWCSRACYLAGHFWDYVFTALFSFSLAIIFTPLAIMYPGGAYLLWILYPLGAFAAISAAFSHENRNKISRKFQ